MMEAVAVRDGANAILVVDTETNAGDVRDGRGYCVGTSASLTFGAGTYFAHYFPLKHKDDPNNISDEQFARWKRIIENWPGWLVFHNAKFDLVVLQTMGIDYKGKFYDTMLMCHLINENFPFEKSLNGCVKYYVNAEESKKDDIGFKTLIKIKGWGGLTAVEMWAYAEHDARITHKLLDAIMDKFKRECPDKYWEHKQRFTRVMIKMESRGVLIDKGMSSAMIEVGEAELERIRGELKGFNPGSSKDLKRLFIDKLGMPVVKLTDAGKKKVKAGEEFDFRDYASFDKEAMEEYDRLLDYENDPTAQLVFAYRGWQKTVSSNYRAYLNTVSPDGRVRPNYKLHGTRTGRVSCAEPNLQQIPRSSEKPWNGNLKQAFIAQAGYELWEFDYSQLELRLATAYADVQELKKVFFEDRDIFTEMSVGLGMVRQDTKTFVYSTQYGAGLDRLMHVFKITRAQAEEMRNNYYNTYPGFVRVSNRAKTLCKARGKVELWSGRYRHFWDRQNDAHKAFNSVIQGGAADIVESVMVRLMEEIDDDENCRMLLTVHDSVVFEIRTELVEVYTPQIIEIMTDVKPDFGVKFAVEGKKWGSK
jgi:DNA polymerase-1